MKVSKSGTQLLMACRVCMSSGSNRGLCDTVVDSQHTKFLKVS